MTILRIPATYFDPKRGRGTLDFKWQVDVNGDINWNPKKSPGPKWNPNKSHTEFWSLPSTQKEINDNNEEQLSTTGYVYLYITLSQ